MEGREKMVVTMTCASELFMCVDRVRCGVFRFVWKELWFIL